MQPRIKFRRRSVSRTAVGRFVQSAQYFVERLESRRLLSAATISWTGASSGFWDVASNWSANRVPNSSDVVSINAAAGVTVTVRSGGNFAGSVVSNNSLSLTGGNLSVSGSIQVNNNFSLNGGTLAGATITAGTGGQGMALGGSGGTLSGVTIASGVLLDATQNYPSLSVINGLTLNGTLDLGSANGNVYGRLYFASSNQTLAGTGSIVLGGSTSNAIYSQGNGNFSGAVTLTIASGITLSGGSGYIGGYYSGYDSLINNATITVPNSQALSIGGYNWVNSGSIAAASGSTVYLGGTFNNAALGNFSATGATVNLTGRLNNTTLALAPAKGNWQLSGGYISGGTVTSTGGSSLVVIGGTLSGVTVASGVVLDESTYYSNLTVTNNLVLNGTLKIGGSNNYSNVTFNGGGSLTGTGAVTFGTSTSNSLYASGGVLTLGSGITIGGGSGNITGSNTSNGDSIINYAAISVPAGRTLSIGGFNWVNSGTITAASGSTVNLGGFFNNAALGNFTASGATVNLTGTLNNSTLALSPSIGNWALSNGYINGGTVTSTGGSTLALSGGTLSGVTIASGVLLDATQNYPSLSVINGLTLNGTLDLGSANGNVYGRLYFASSNQTLAGTGSIVLGGSTNNAIYSQGNGNFSGAVTLTIASGITLSGGSGYIGGYYSGYDSLINNATITVPNSQALSIGGYNWVNSGSIAAASGSTVYLGGTFNNAALGNFSATGATVNLTGRLNNTTLALAPAKGNWQLSGGYISGGTVTSTGGSSLVVIGGTLSGVTVASGVVLDESTYYSNLTVTNNLVLNGTLKIGGSNNYSNVTFNGGGSLTGTGAVTFGTSTSNSLYASGGVLTLGSGITIGGGSGNITGSNTSNGDSIINYAAISVPAGRTLSIGGFNWVNSGTITAASGSTVNLGGFFNNAALGNFTASGATVNLTGTLNNSTLALSPSIGNWALSNGYINGGTVTSTGGSTLALSGGTLSGVTIASGVLLDATQNYPSLSVINGLTLNGTLDLGSANGNVYGRLYFASSNQTLAGTGSIVLGGSTNNAIYSQGNGNFSGAVTLTIASGITLSGGSGYIGGYYSGYDSVTNNAAVSVNNSGNLSLPSLKLASAQPAAVDFTSTLSFSGNLLANSTSYTQFNPAGTLYFNGTGTAGSPQLLEAMSADSGSGAAGFKNNFAIGTLSLSGNTFVQLVDQSDNSTGSTAEAVYTNSLIVPSGSTLNLNGLNLYVRNAQIGGTVTGGSITQIPNAGPLQIATPTPGKITTAGELDNWTFFDRGTDSITVAVDPGSGTAGGPSSPTLQYAQIQLLDPSGTVLATTSSTSSGAVLRFNNIQLTTDGTYTIAVKAPSTHTSATGNYIISAYDVTANVQALNVNQQVTSTISSPYAQDQWTFSATANTQVQFKLAPGSTTGLSYSLTGPNNFTAFSNATTSSTLINLPNAGTYTLTAQGLTGQTGRYGFTMMQTSVTSLPLSTLYTGTSSGSGQAQLFAIPVTTPNPLSVVLADAKTADHNELYIRFGQPPTRETYDYGVSASGASQSLLVPNASVGTWYVLVYNESVAVPPGSFTLQANSASVVLASSSPGTGASNVPTTFTLKGAGFVTGSIVNLIGSGGTVYPATTTSVDLQTQITAVFAAGTVPAGSYKVQIVRPDNTSAQLAAAFTMIQTGVGRLSTKIEVPNPIGNHATATLYVDYTNTGTVAVAAPLLILDATRPATSGNGVVHGAYLTLDPTLITSGYWTNATPQGFSTSVQILASGKTPGVLQPGETGRVPVYYGGWISGQWNFSNPTINFNLSAVQANDTTPTNWSTTLAAMQPSTISSAAWSGISAALLTKLGTTAGSYVQLLDNASTYLGRLGDNITSVPSLWSFELQQANSGVTSVGPVLTSTTDDTVTAPGESITFGRSFSNTITGRTTQGILGYGWSTPWETRASVASDGTVTILGVGASQEVFQPDSRYGGVYFSSTGDYNKLTADGNGGYLLTAPSGSRTDFFANGKLRYIQDTNNNRITAGYTNGTLTSLTHTSGESVTIAYNGAGLVSGLTDSAGKFATYTYNSSNQLISFQDFAGRTTAYGYVGTTGAAANALSSITSPGGLHTYYTYDSQGRISTTAADGNAQKVTYTYNEGAVTTTDLLSDATTKYFDANGLLAKSSDARGNVTYASYDPNFNLILTTGPTGLTQNYTYDSRGNVTASTDQLGNSTSFAYGTNSRLTQLTDTKGNQTNYTYSAAGNLLSTTYADNSQSTSVFNPLGEPTSFLNQNGQPITYAYNTAGQLTSEGFSDGTSYAYTYDAHGNLLTAVDSTGTTSFTYDSADRMTKVTYPGNLWLSFSYNTDGQRTQMVDQTGFTTNYQYDSVGRLSGLTDGSGNAVVTYAYDAAGRLSQKVNGNGTYTTYAYDADGNVLHLINYAPGGAVNSRFDYTYDSLSNVSTEATVDGAWTYSYDADGQLTHAVFASTNPNIPNQDLTYNYDAMGNRTSTVINGVTTQYLSNSRNQYTSVGSQSLTYDADGNLLNDGVNAMSYNALDQVVSASTVAGNTSFTYGALNNISSETFGGVKDQAIVDPVGMTHVVSMINSMGNVDSRRTYGLELAKVVAGGATTFLDYDLAGSTADTTDTAGILAARQSFNPFGDSLVSGAPNTQFAAAFGSISLSSDLTLLNRRVYSASTGRFTSPDPIGLIGGDDSLYRFVGNSPVASVDPSGLVLNVLYQNKALEYEIKAADAADQNNYGDAQKYQALADHFNELAVESTDASSQIIGVIGTGTTPITGIPEHPFEWGTFLHGNIIQPLLDHFHDRQPEPTPPQSPTKQVPPPPIAGTPAGGTTQTPVQAQDPNAKIGPSGYGASNFLPDSGTFPYKVEFENAATATAPAQQVTITDQLNSNLDWTTFQLTQIGFADNNIVIPANSQSYQTTLSMTYAGQTFDVLMQAGIHTATGQVYANFYSIDPLTGLPPGVLAGFLPPEDGTGRGQGYFSYSVSPKSNVANGTQITNVAGISFDGAQPITTDQADDEDPSKGTDSTKRASLTIDSAAATSNVAALPANTPNASFTVSWSGQDTNGSGIAGYDIYVSDNGGSYTPWITATSDSSATYNGVTGHTYSFYSIATDNVGNVELAPATPDATTTIGNALPAWLSSNSVATWNATTHTLNVTGVAQIIGDPGSDEPVILASGSAAQISIAPASAKTVHVGGLSLTNGASATLVSLGGSRTEANHRVLVLGTTDATSAPTFTIGSTSTLDLADNDLIDLYGTGNTPLQTVLGYIRTAYDAALWDKPGLTSSVTKAKPATNGLGYGEASTLKFSSFDGVSLGGHAVVVKYALLGDVALTGSVDLSGYTAVVQNFGGSGKLWTDGDWGYSGTVDLADYTTVIQDFGKTMP